MATCFEETFAKHANTKNYTNKCQQECSFTKYSISVKEEELDRNYEKSQTYGKLWQNYASDINPQIIAKGRIQVYDYARGKQIEPFHMIDATSLIHVNFEDHEVTVITKDAKVTFADQLGNIGGTFGMFLGLSFLGLFQLLLSTLRTARERSKTWISRYWIK